MTDPTLAGLVEAPVDIGPRLRELAEECRENAAVAEHPGEFPEAEFSELAMHLESLAGLAAPSPPDHGAPE